ncbi:MAG: hypothetical protein ACRDLV_16365 [Solirubrobacteraceae bacterium]
MSAGGWVGVPMGAVVGRLVTFRRLELASFAHSLGYLALLVCWLAFAQVQPETAIFGWIHGVVWIIMSLLCIDAARRGVIPFWLAVTVAVLGGLGPFAGSIGFIVADRRRRTDGPPGPQYSER